jgi:hypothetical protein
MNLRERELCSARDERWVHGLLAFMFALAAFALGQILESDRAMTAARQLMAERQPHLQKDALEKAKGEVMEWFEASWVCRGFDVELECNLRERRP